MSELPGEFKLLSPLQILSITGNTTLRYAKIIYEFLTV